jgi:hypothetical protein
MACPQPSGSTRIEGERAMAITVLRPSQSWLTSVETILPPELWSSGMSMS